jgi:phosphonate transport system permease protein
VGAGGIGAEIDLSIRYFQFDKLATALLAVLLCILVFEFLSSFLRRKNTSWSLAFLCTGIALGAPILDIPWNGLWSESALHQGGLFLGAFGSPTTDWPFVSRAFALMGETLAMAFWGTAIAAVIAFFLAPLATRQLTMHGFLADAPRGRGWIRWLHGSIFVVCRFALQILRALPELVWALIFVVWVGPGAFAGALAVAAHTVGILGRLFSDCYKEVEAEAPANLEAVGVGLLGRWGYGVLPQVAPRILAFALFRFEVNVRATAMVGFVGAGGIGNAIHTAISLYHMGDLAALLFTLLVTVGIVDLIGDRIRLKILRY